MAAACEIRLSPRSHLVLRRGALAVTAAEFAELHKFLVDRVPKSRNPRNPKQFLKRVQCTFAIPGAMHYDFGQEQHTFASDPAEWPPVVRRALEHARASCLLDAQMYNGVHVNLYADATVGVNAHADKEKSMVAGKTIYSYTLLRDVDNPRPFSVYTYEDSAKLHDIYLRHGDLLEMHGAMQTEFKHGIETYHRASQFGPRINLTVRAFQEEQRLPLAAARSATGTDTATTGSGAAAGDAEVGMKRKAAVALK